MAASVMAVLNNPALSGRLREKGIRRAREFTWDRAARQTLAVYEEVIAGRNPLS
jgi:glycosyltransferase involved in cell wall biosynthesis